MNSIKRVSIAKHMSCCLKCPCRRRGSACSHSVFLARLITVHGIVWVEFALLLVRFILHICATSDPLRQIISIGGVGDGNLAGTAFDAGQAKLARRVFVRRQVDRCGIRLSIVAFPDVLQHLEQVDTIRFFNFLMSSSDTLSLFWSPLGQQTRYVEIPFMFTPASLREYDTYIRTVDFSEDRFDNLHQ